VVSSRVRRILAALFPSGTVAAVFGIGVLGPALTGSTEMATGKEAGVSERPF
jgi:hypothetical protein